MLAALSAGTAKRSTDWNAAAIEAVVRAYAERAGAQARRGGAAAARGADRPHHLAADLRRAGGARARRKPGAPARSGSRRSLAGRCCGQRRAMARPARDLAVHTWMGYPNDAGTRDATSRVPARAGPPSRVAANSRARSWTPRPAPTQDRLDSPSATRTGTFPIYDGTIGPDVIDIAKLYGETGMFTYDPGFTSTGELRVQDHLHRRRRRHPALSRLSDRAARRARRLPRDLLPAALRRTADRRRRRPISTTASRATRWCTSR